MSWDSKLYLFLTMFALFRASQRVYSIKSWLVFSTSNTKRTGPSSAAFSVFSLQISGTPPLYTNLYILYSKIVMETFHVCSVLSFSKDPSSCAWLVSLLVLKQRYHQRMFCFFLCFWNSKLPFIMCIFCFLFRLWPSDIIYIYLL